jgi:Ca2+-dependent lipid-binding protein
VRVYVLKGYQLKAMDKRENNSDPYIKLKLGDQVISDRANFQKNVSSNAKFYKNFEMQAKFPGSSKLEVMVMDRDAIVQDNLVGKTIVDLEDRCLARTGMR